MSDAQLARWRRDERRRQWVRHRLPRPLRRVISVVYNQRPAARLWREGVADRARVACLVHERCAGVVRRGPFEGMKFPFATTDAGAKCIGSYERELHPEVERIIASGYQAIINVGCAEGFYAVGFARSMPDPVVYAYDTSPGAVKQCQELATANGLPPGRIAYGGEVSHTVLDKLCVPGTIVLSDIEGGEAALLDPNEAPGLTQVDMLVELHHNVVPGVEQLLRDRFSRTHDIRQVDSEPRTDPTPYPELGDLSAEDQRTAMFERPIAMRWLLLAAKVPRPNR